MRLPILLCALALCAITPSRAAEPPGIPISPRPPDTPPEQRDPALGRRPQPDRQDLVRPRFIRTPSAADINRRYPGAAVRTFTPGDVILDCRVAASGRLDHCFVLSETPPARASAPPPCASPASTPCAQPRATAAPPSATGCARRSASEPSRVARAKTRRASPRRPSPPEPAPPG